MAVQIIKDRWVTLPACAGLLLLGCSGGEETAPLQLPVAAGLNALQIAQNLYDNAGRTPDSFYREPVRDPQFFYTTTHLKLSNIDANVAGNPSLPDHELCATNWTAADDLERTFRAASSPASQRLNATSTRQYFEFEADVPGSLDRRNVVRIFDCNFVDRSAVNIRAPNGEGGTINERPVDEEPVRFLAEYSFMFSPYNNVGYQVLASDHSSDASTATQTLLVAELIAAGSGENCDRLTVFAIRHTADRGDGRVRVSEITEWSLLTQQVDGRAQTCS